MMQIGEAARRAGLTVKTVRYYANIGMVTPRQDPDLSLIHISSPRDEL